MTGCPLATQITISVLCSTVEIEFVRIAQEALTNAYRHAAQAQTIRLQLGSETAASICYTLTMDRAFDPESHL